LIGLILRARNLKPGFFKNYHLALIAPPWGRLLFAGLWCLADREGRLKDIPEWIKAEVFPYDEKITVSSPLDNGYHPTHIDELLNMLSEGKDPFISRYEVGGFRYIQINNFRKHQNPHHTEKPSIIPQVTKNKNSPLNHREITVKSRKSNGEYLADSLNPDSTNILAHFLLKKIKERDPKAKDPDFKLWCKDIRLLIEKDGRTEEEVRSVIDWCQKDSFWQNNILSPAKLRKQFTQLKLKMESASTEVSKIIKEDPYKDFEVIGTKP
jgi:hypothetical protein